MPTPHKPYDPKRIESKWQQVWENAGVFTARKDDRPKYYLLEMLPYPSGDLHMGHVRNYAIGDVVARYKWMNGLNVLHPIGWDSFGMPAENAAIQHKVHPHPWTLENIATMKSQFRQLGISYDWSRELSTCEPEYYRWEQWLFTRLYDRGFAFRKNSVVNWCPTCKTVLANEQVEQGLCWRCDSTVLQQPMTQWFFRLPDYAEVLLKDIDTLPGWPDRVRTMQREWIGRSVGAEIVFAVEGLSDTIGVFTTRPDTLFGVTFVSLAINHPIVERLVTDPKILAEVKLLAQRQARIDHASRVSGQFEKEGLSTGRYAIHPLTGEKLPIYLANFVLMDYGTGAVMAVPAHDPRDFEFAKKYKLPIKVVIQDASRSLDDKTLLQAYADDGTLVASGEFSGLNNRIAMEKIAAKLASVKRGGPRVTYKLRDWCISRQRYWGTPIPVIYCDACGTVPVPEKDLPVLLPRDVALTGEGGSPLAKVEAFVNTTCPRCNARARRETDTMDTFVESSWYFLRYCSPKFDKGIVDVEEVKYWMPVDQYIGGIEHAVGHLLYCRLFMKLLRDLDILKFSETNEPVVNLLTQGMVCKDGAKMSKSKGNVVDPNDMIATYGADTARLFLLFAAPPELDLEWSDKGVEGSFRFLNRVWRLVMEWMGTCADVQMCGCAEKASLRIMHRTIQRVTQDIERMHFNTAIAAMMEYLNHLSKLESLQRDSLLIKTFVQLLAPFAPHMAEELWGVLGETGMVCRATWPKADPQYLTRDTINIAVQVNGRLRQVLEVAADTSEGDVKRLAKEAEKVAAHIAGRQIVKEIYVQGRLLNIVVK